MALCGSFLRHRAGARRIAPAGPHLPGGEETLRILQITLIPTPNPLTNMGTYIIATLLFLALAYALYKTFSKRGKCCGNCDGCGNG
ncbi:FeoB-associated Cys-rich membrane protein, partial [Akkermansia sp.]|uniref:FeoB-associated Cys-rich membrane protein n=1 Tax=Akkermansia sp. TaxID=1872421 RepID=UPI003AF1A55D